MPSARLFASFSLLIALMLGSAYATWPALPSLAQPTPDRSADAGSLPQPLLSMAERSPAIATEQAGRLRSQMGAEHTPATTAEQAGRLRSQTGAENAPVATLLSGTEPARGMAAAPAVASPPVAAEAAARLELARRLRRGGELDEAVEVYRSLLAAPDAPAVAALELAQTLAAAGDAAEAERIARAALSSATPGIGSRLHFLIGSLAYAAGDWERAADHFAQYEPPPDLADLIALQLAEVNLRLGDPAAARRHLEAAERTARSNWALMERAAAIWAGLGEPSRAAARYAQAANGAFWSADRSRLLVAAATAAARANDDDLLGRLLRSLVESAAWIPEGRRAAERLASPDLLTDYHAALLAFNRGEPAAAQAALNRYLQAHPDGAYADAARRLQHGVRERREWLIAADESTAAAYQTFLARYPASARAPEAHFRMGYSHYRAGRIADAVAAWQSEPPGATGDDRARLHLWLGIAAHDRDQPELTRREWRAAAAIPSAGYYALRARHLLAGESGWPSATGASRPPADGDWAAAERWVATWAPASGVVFAARPAAVRLGELAALGLLAEAQAEASVLLAELAEDPAGLLALGHAAGQAGLDTVALRAASRLMAASPSRSMDDAPIAVQRLAYPDPFPELVERVAARWGVAPDLLRALVRQESAWDPSARSIAAATGLTQVMPATAAGIARSLGLRRFQTNDLFRPAVSLQFGAWYLGNQLQTYRSDVFRAVAAYNAGGGPIAGWAAADPDRFVENVDYPETRAYIQQLYVQTAWYARLR